MYLFRNFGELRDPERVACVPPGLEIPALPDRPSDSMVEKLYRARVFLNEGRRRDARSNPVSARLVAGYLRSQAD